WGGSSNCSTIIGSLGAGPTRTCNVTLTGVLVVCAALVLGAVIAFVNAVRGPRERWLVAAVVPAVVWYVGVQGIAWYVSSFIVKPNELVCEKPYIVYNTDLTRQAYGLKQALQDTLRQIQEIRTYYDFPDIDIDRYEINGATREVMLATR